MLGYSKTSFYKLECKDPEVTEIYVGSTTDFYTRKSVHKRRCINKDGEMKYNLPVYCFMRLNGGWDNWNMLEIDVVNCRSKRHKNQIEAKYIRELGATLNREIPQDIDEGLGEKEWRKEYYKKNREKIAERHKEYGENNREKISEYKKEYRKNNREKISEYHKVWYEKNREKLAEKAKEIVKCECGSEVTKYHLVRHKRTQKHQNWENLPEPNLIFVENKKNNYNVEL